MFVFSLLVLYHLRSCTVVAIETTASEIAADSIIVANAVNIKMPLSIGWTLVVQSWPVAYYEMSLLTRIEANIESRDAGCLLDNNIRPLLFTQPHRGPCPSFFSN